MISRDLSQKVRETIVQNFATLEREGVITVIPYDTYVFLKDSPAYRERTRGLVEGGIIDGRYAVYFGTLKE